MRAIKMMIVAAIMMFAAVIPSSVSSASACGETVSRNTASSLKAVDYDTDEKIGKLLAPSRYSLADQLNKKLEISKRDNRKITEITDEEALTELNQDNVKIMSYGETFEEVQGEIEQIIQRIVDGTDGAQEKGAEFFTQKILQNKELLLLGLAYLERLYDFNMGDKNIKDILIYAPDTYGVKVDALDWLIKIGNAGGDTLKVSNNAKVFGWNKLFSSITSSMTLGAFLEENRQKWIPDMSLEEWFLQESHAYIVEKMSSWDSKTDAGLYTRLYDDAGLQSHILPLLTVSEDSVYVIANSSTITYGIVDCYVDRELKNTAPALYVEKREQFRQQLEQIAWQQKEFIDLWYRLAKPEVRSQLSSNRVVMDSLRIYADRTVNASSEWSAKFGKDASVGVREFFTPLNMYDSFFFSDGMAAGTGVRYYLSKALTERGLATYAHELTHLLISSVMLNQYGSRDGMQAEVYTRGMFEPYELNDPPAFNLNLIYDRRENSERFHNAAPAQFQEEKNLQTYMSGILDVIYTLDYAEAEALFTKTPEEKQKWFHKLEQIEDTSTRSNQGDAGSKHNLDSVRELTLDEAKELNTLDDLIRDSILVSRYEVNGVQTTGTMAGNGYYVVPLFSANYAGVQNDRGVSGDVMIRRQAFELLAEYGYYGGMVPYISNQYKADAAAEQTVLSDTYILQKIFGGTYETMADFKKAMFQKRIEKVDELRPITIVWKNAPVTIDCFETLQRLMSEAVESDLENVQVMPGGYNNIRAQETDVEQLKAQIFKAYLQQTNDFQEPIYGAGQEPAEPTETPQPSAKPTVTPTAMPSVKPSAAPTAKPTVTPTAMPSVKPSAAPTAKPIATPTVTPLASTAPTMKPIETAEPTKTPQPSAKPTATPTVVSPEGEEVEEGEEEEEDILLPEGEAGKTLLLAKVSSAKTSQIIRWNAVKSADGYYIYGAKSGAKYKRLRTVNNKTFKWKRVKLKTGTEYKYYVAAYKVIGGRKVIFSKSMSVCGMTKGGKFGNPVRIQAKRSLVKVKAGKASKLNIKVSGKNLKKGSKRVRYICTEPSIAKVSKKGTVTGVRPGTCDVYCVAWNGLSRKIKVKVTG
ncbi:MAG: hypothetical protein NC293_08215 [Roseburia sp.]|nr:hypothetical protein [Roseburia sp.]